MSTVCGQRIKERRQKLNMTQDELAEKIGYTSNRNISNYEKGTRSPDFETLCKIADALSCTTDYLLGREENDTHEAASVADQTGLLPTAVEMLIDYKNDKDGSYIAAISTFLSDLLLSNEIVDLSVCYCLWKRRVASPGPISPADVNMIPGQYEDNFVRWRRAMDEHISYDYMISGARYSVARHFEEFLTEFEDIAKDPAGYEKLISIRQSEKLLTWEFEKANRKGDNEGVEAILKAFEKLKKEADDGKGKE